MTRTPLTHFLQYHVLIEVFDGDLDAWLEALDFCRDAPWCHNDRDFLLWLKLRLRRDPGMMNRIRRSVESSSRVLARLPVPATTPPPQRRRRGRKLRRLPAAD